MLYVSILTTFRRKSDQNLQCLLPECDWGGDLTMISMFFLVYALLTFDEKHHSTIQSRQCSPKTSPQRWNSSILATCINCLGTTSLKMYAALREDGVNLEVEICLLNPWNSANLPHVQPKLVLRKSLTANYTYAMHTNVCFAQFLLPNAAIYNRWNLTGRFSFSCVMQLRYTRNTKSVASENGGK